MSKDSLATESPQRRNSSGLRRDIEVLEALGTNAAVENGGLGVLQLATLVGRDKGQVSRTLATLAEAGLVSRDPATLSYSLGHRLYALAARTSESHLVRASARYLRRIVSATHETTHLCVLRAGSVFTLASELPEHAFRGIGLQGASNAAWCTSAGRVLISGWPDDELAEWYEVHGHDDPITGPGFTGFGKSSVLPPPEENLIVTDFETLLAEVQRIRAQGYATVDEEFEIGVVGVSAPVYDFSGGIIAAVNVTAPKARLGKHLDEVGRYAARAAADLSKYLGGKPGAIASSAPTS